MKDKKGEILSEFYSTLDYKPLTSNAIAIYVILIEIAEKSKWLKELRVANGVFISKIKNLNLSSLQRARNELINNNYIGYKKGKNQNDAPRYFIIDLYDNEQADEQTNEQANEQADDNIIIKLNNYFNYLNNSKNFKKFSKHDKNIIRILKKIDVYVGQDEAVEIMLNEANRLEEFKIYYWVVKEIYYSPYKSYLSRITYEKLIIKYSNTIKNISKKGEYTTIDILNYLIKCLYKEAEEV